MAVLLVKRIRASVSRISAYAWCLVWGAGCLPTQAGVPDWGAPLPDAELHQHRGGFESPQGLQISFGLSRQVFINGVLQSSQTWQMVAGGTALGGGAGMPGGLQGVGDLAPLVIQNQSHGQEIRTLTVLDAQLNSLQLLGAARLHQSLHSALISALPR